MQQQLDILLIENDAASALLTKEALKEAGLQRSVRSVRDGDEAMMYLKGEQHFSGRTTPHVIFLDLHLPRQSGLQVLETIKSDPQLMVIPVVVISGSADPEEVRKAYELHASCYIRKPDDLGDLLQFMSICFQFWGSVVTLPTAV